MFDPDEFLRLQLEAVNRDISTQILKFLVWTIEMQGLDFIHCHGSKLVIQQAIRRKNQTVGISQLLMRTFHFISQSFWVTIVLYSGKIASSE
jgi:hypothetical protein